MVLICFTAISETNYISKFSLRLQTFWNKEELPEIKSVWPVKHEFPSPLVVSNIQVWPATAKQVAAQQTESDVKLQLQLFGNKHGKSSGEEP